MGIELEGLEFQIKAKSNEGVKGIEALSASLGKLKQATKGGLGLNSSVKQLGKLNDALKGFQSDKLESLGKALQGLESVGNVTISATIPKRLGEIAASLHQLNWSDVEKLEALGTALRDMKDVGDVKIPKITTPVTGAATVTPAGGDAAGAAVSGVGQATSQVQEVSAAVDQVANKTSFLKRILGGIGGVFSKGFSMGTGALLKLGNALTKVKVAGAKARTALGKLKDIMGSALAAKVKQSTAGMGQLFSSIKRIAMYRAIRAALSAFTKAMQEGINNLYQYSNLMGGMFSQSMNSVATNALYLKNSLGAMAAPIINALAPAIDYLSGKIVSLLNLINMLIARLTGSSTYTAAKKMATAYGDAADSAAGSAKKAVDKIKSYTSGIDELNIIQENPDNDSGSGGAGGKDYGSMFEELPINNQVSEFADKLKQAFDNADWKTLGTLIGEKVNELVDSIDWCGIGHKIGFALNGAVQTAYWFLDTVNFTNIGARIAELLNGALEEIDFTYAGRIFVKWFTLLPDMIIGFLVELDWGKVGKSIGDFFIGAFDEATKWLDKYNWSDLGATLWQKIKDLIAGIDWSGLAKSIFTFLGTAIRSVVQFLGGFFGSIGSDIKNWWDSEIQGQDWKETAGNLLSAIGKGFADIGTWVWDNIVDPLCSALLGKDTWADVKKAGSDLWAGFTKGITEFFDDPGAWIKTHIVDPFVDWFKNLFGIHSPSTVMAEIGGFIIQGLLKGILEPFKAIGTWIKDNILDPLVEAFDESPVAKFAVGVKNQASTWWSNVKTWWSGKVGEVQSFTTSVANHAVTWWSNVKTWWSGKVGAVKEFTTSVTNQASTWWSNVKTWWSGKVGAVQQFTTSVKNEASTWWSNVKSWWSGQVGAVQQFTTSVKDQASTWWSNTKTYWSGKVGAVQEFTTSVKNEAATWWSNVKTWWSGKVGAVASFTVGVKNEASTWWSNVKSWWSEKVGSLWTSLQIKLPRVVVDWHKDPIFGKVDLPSFSIEWNAKGGILDGAQLFGMMGGNFLGGGEAGKEAVLPLESHTEWMDTLAEKVRNGLPEEDSGGMEYAGFKRALGEFYVDYVQGTMSQMASDMNRQANKQEQTHVQIGNRVITDAVKTQKDANGYSFTT
jgi:hypothetical protein